MILQEEDTEGQLHGVHLHARLEVHEGHRHTDTLDWTSDIAGTSASHRRT